MGVKQAVNEWPSNWAKLERMNDSHETKAPSKRFLYLLAGVSNPYLQPNPQNDEEGGKIHSYSVFVLLREEEKNPRKKTLLNFIPWKST